MPQITGYPSGSGELDPTVRRASATFKPQPCSLGFMQSDGFNEYLYVQAGAAISAGQAVKITSPPAGTLLVGNSGQANAAVAFVSVVPTAAAVNQPMIGVANVAFNSGDWGYIIIRGIAQALVNAAVTAGVVLVSDAAGAGQLNTAAATDLAGAKACTALTAASGGLAFVYLQ